ncbi:hypothetical protein CKAH01_15609 [Colletotrichum kahawae]|uniref:Uncharacterized protein n=1 Tax=Colletotrichum kahawae TaxID=34407 RepID=A0AAD9YHV0_COLKA|nr:hypothetical protein CKAH01_15609 [Colletotrichum kahawae]
MIHQSPFSSSESPSETPFLSCMCT